MAGKSCGSAASYAASLVICAIAASGQWRSMPDALRKSTKVTPASRIGGDISFALPTALARPTSAKLQQPAPRIFFVKFLSPCVSFGDVSEQLLFAKLLKQEGALQFRIA